MTEKPQSLPDPAGGDGASGTSFGELAKQALGRALVLQAERPSLSDPELGKLIEALCDGAQAGGLKAERLIIDLKQLWISLPGAADSTEKAEVRSRLVSMCITEYYRDGRGGGKPR